LQNLEIAFLGKITASMTHEMKNALAIIQESSGLMSDLLTLGQKTPFPFQEKFAKVLAAIDEQVRRGVEISNRLNRFAHSMDVPQASVHLPELLEQTAFLMQRFAHRNKLKILPLPAEKDLVVETDPFRLQLVLATIIEDLIEGLDPGGVILLHSQAAELGPVVKVLAQGQTKSAWTEFGKDSPLPEKFSPLLPLLHELGYSLTRSDKPGEQGYKLTFA